MLVFDKQTNTVKVRGGAVYVCVRACACACARARVCACVRACVCVCVCGGVLHLFPVLSAPEHVWESCL